MQNILVTGATGLIGPAAVASLRTRYTVRALNRRPLPHIDCHQADIADIDAIRPAFAGIDTFFVNSDNKWSYRDLEHARQTVGFVPADRAEDYR